MEAIIGKIFKILQEKKMVSFYECLEVFRSQPLWDHSSLFLLAPGGYG